MATKIPENILTEFKYIYTQTSSELLDLVKERVELFLDGAMVTSLLESAIESDINVESIDKSERIAMFKICTFMAVSESLQRVINTINGQINNNLGK